MQIKKFKGNEKLLLEKEEKRIYKFLSKNSKELIYSEFMKNIFGNDNIFLMKKNRQYIGMAHTSNYYPKDIVAYCETLNFIFQKRIFDEKDKKLNLYNLIKKVAKFNISYSMRLVYLNTLESANQNKQHVGVKLINRIKEERNIGSIVLWPANDTEKYYEKQGFLYLRANHHIIPKGECKKPIMIWKNPNQLYK